jgi:hypothetical protein
VAQQRHTAKLLQPAALWICGFHRHCKTMTSDMDLVLLKEWTARLLHRPAGLLRLLPRIKGCRQMRPLRQLRQV